LRARLDAEIDRLLAAVTGASATTTERVSCLVLADLLDDPPAPDAAALFVDLLAARGDSAAPVLRAIADLGPPAVARLAADQVEGAGPRPPALIDLQSIPLEGSELIVVALERPDEPWYHGHVILEDHADGPRLVSSALGPAPPGQTPQETLVDLAGEDTVTVRLAQAEARRRIAAGAASTRAAGVGVGSETTAGLPLIARALDMDPAEVWGLSATGGPSKLIVEAEDEGAFRMLLEGLVAGLADWARERYDGEPGLEPLALELLLETKWAAGQRDLGRWTTDDLAALLLGALPRAGIEPALARDLPAAFADALAFLHERGLLAGEPLPVLEQALDELGDELVAVLAAERPRPRSSDRKRRAKAKRKSARQARRRNR
jgi:hypothetical protein